MKKITYSISIVSLLIISGLMLLFFEIKESGDYKSLENHKYSGFYLSENLSNIENYLDLIIKAAEENNIILSKILINEKQTKAEDIYISFKKISDFKNYYKIDFSKGENFVSTYDEKAIGKISDMFNNNKINYYLMDELIDSNKNLMGSYIIYYKNNNDYYNFTLKLDEILGYDSNINIILSNTSKFIIILVLISIIILMIFFIIFQTYNYNNDIKKISCMKLLGTENKRIKKILYRKENIIIILFSLVLLILLSIFIINIKIRYIIIIFLIFTFLFILKEILCKWVFNKISSDNNLSSFIKKKDNNNLILISYGFKIFLTVISTITLCICFSNFLKIKEELKLYNSSKNMLDYGILKSFIADRPELTNYEDQANFYLDLINDKRINTFYASFTNYNNIPIENLERMESSGEYIIDSIDKNYIIKEKIIILDDYDNIIDISDNEKMFFLIPISKKKNKNKILNYYASTNSEKNEFEVYYYKDRKFDTYSLDFENKYVENPYLRVINKDITKPLFHFSDGVCVFGMGLSQGLRIKIENTKEDTFNIIHEHLVNNNLENLLPTEVFTSYKEYFNDQILISSIMTTILTIGFTLIILVYCFVIKEIYKLYIMSNRKEIYVKLLLGYNKKDVFNSLISNEFVCLSVSLVISLLVVLKYKFISIIYFLIIFILIQLINKIINTITYKNIKTNKIQEELKG